MTREPDIVERLRRPTAYGDEQRAEAADEIERLTTAIAYVCQRSQRACEILNEFDNMRAALEPKP